MNNNVVEYTVFHFGNHLVFFLSPESVLTTARMYLAQQTISASTFLRIACAAMDSFVSTRTARYCVNRAKSRSVKRSEQATSRREGEALLGKGSTAFS